MGGTSSGGAASPSSLRSTSGSERSSSMRAMTSLTPNGLTIIDWKTTETLKKYRRHEWQCYQQVLYAGAINRCFILDQPVQQGMSVTFAEDGWKVEHWRSELFMPRWAEVKQLIWEFWNEQLELGELTDWPGAAPRAIDTMKRQWGAQQTAVAA